MASSPGLFEPVAVLRRMDVAGLPEGLAATIIAVGALAMVLVAVARPVGVAATLMGKSAQILAERMAARGRMLEAVHGAVDILPARPGQAVDLASARAALAGNATELSAALGGLAGHAQYGVAVRWRPAEALRRFAGEAELAGRTEPRARAEGAEALRVRFGAVIAGRLASAAADRIVLDCDPGPEMLTDVALLLTRGGEPALDREVEAIDAVWPEGLQIRTTGPGAPEAFGAFEIEVPGAAAAAARRLVGMAQGPLRPRPVPERGGPGGDAARDLLRRLGAAAAAVEAAGLPAPGYNVPLVRILRIADAASRAVQREAMA